MASSTRRRERSARILDGLGSIVGQDHVVQFLTTGMRQGRLAHALLMSGPQGVGKHATALALAQALNCPVRPGEGCGTCNTCSRILRAVHPDVLEVEPDGRWIKIDQVRALEGRIGDGPHEANTLVIIFDPADRMNAAAANALLKSLEEPRKSVLFCLVTSAPHAVLPTVRSRCQGLRFGPLSNEDLTVLLHRVAADSVGGLDEDSLQRVVDLAEGSVGRALELASDEQFDELLGLVDRTLVAATALFDPVTHFAFAATLADLGRDLERFLSILEFEVRRRMRKSLAMEGNRDQSDEESPVLLVVPQVTTFWYGAIERARARFRSNANRRLLCEALLMDLTSASRGAGS